MSLKASRIRLAVAGGVRRAVAGLSQSQLRLGGVDTAPLEPFDQGSVRVSCLRDWPDDSVVDRWEALLDSTSDWSAFQSAAWQRAVFRQITPGRYRFIAAAVGDQVLAVLPLFLRLGWLETPGARVSDYLDPPAAIGREQEAWRAILGLLRAQWDRGISAVVLRNMRHDSRVRAALHAIASDAGFELTEESDGTAAAVRLPPTWDQYVESLPKLERKETRRKLRKAEGEGAARIERCTDTSQVEPLMQDLIRIMESGGGEKGRQATLTLRPFVPGLAADLARAGRADLLTLLIQGQPALRVLALRSAAGPMMWNGGYKPEFRDWSPGRVICCMAIRDAIAAGHRLFDLLRGQEPYKYNLGAVDSPLFRLTLRPK